MTDLHADTNPAPLALPVTAAVDLQDHLLVASNDLDRLHRLLDDASQALLASFSGANTQIEAAITELQQLDGADASAVRGAQSTLHQAITALQFQDIASQLILHTVRRLRSCADRLAAETLVDEDGDGDGEAVIEQAPMNPNPVTQDEMDAGSIELF